MFTGGANGSLGDEAEAADADAAGPRLRRHRQPHAPGLLGTLRVLQFDDLRTVTRESCYLLTDIHLLSLLEFVEDTVCGNIALFSS